MTAINTTRRDVMLMAWSFSRDEPGRAFGDCLRGAWKLTKGLAKSAAKFMTQARRHGGRINFSASLIQSPIERSLTGQPYALWQARQASITTSRLGR
jgi:hypothetical protein